ncbi:MAG: hypothetical protein JWQ27_644 [Ferruginibacter sp.]|nr:hypothetical protein [Ferruginibacter sp.]
MKVEQLIVQYLYNNKTVTVQDIGTFTISPELHVPLDNEKDTPLPEGSIHFDYNTKATQDDGLIEFIVQQTRKIKPLATSDLESYSILSRQFLNIGKPLVIEGLGTLVKTQQGSYEFIQGNTLNAKLEPAPAQMKEKQNEEIVFTTPERPASSNKALAIIIGLVVLAGVAFGIYYLLNHKSADNTLEPVNTDTVATVVPPIVDSNLLKKDTVAIPVAANDGSTFKVVVKEYATRADAEKALKRFSGYGHNLVLVTVDSTHYKLAMPFTKPITDTLLAKDSLKKIFQGQPSILQ